LIERLLTLGVKNKEFDIKDIPVMSDMFVTVTKGLRMVVIKQRDSYFLNEEDYATLPYISESSDIM